MVDKPKINLKTKAVDYLSRREHSRLELSRKLAKFSVDEAEINKVLDDLQLGNWQSDERFAQAYAHKNSAKHGLVRIIHDLRQHGISESCIQDIRDSMGESEYNRAYLVWQKKFDQVTDNPKEYAKQYRFMLSRGFTNDTIRKILAGK